MTGWRAVWFGGALLLAGGLGALYLKWRAETSPPPAAAQNFSIVATPIPLASDDPRRMAVGDARFLGALILESDQPAFGGLSGLARAPDGGLLALGDRGVWMRLTPVMENGRLIGVRDARMAPVLGPDGAPVRGLDADAEGLTQLGDGRYAVSFEQRHRVMIYDLADDLSSTPPTSFIALEDEGLRDNGGMEGLAPGTNGGLLALIEDSMPDGARRMIAFAEDGRVLDDFTLYDADPDFGGVGLDAYHGGYVVLERAFYPVKRTNELRVLSGPIDALRERFRLAPPLIEDNFEAVLAEREGAVLRLWLVSDDNFDAYGPQDTILALFELGLDTTPAG